MPPNTISPATIFFMKSPIRKNLTAPAARLQTGAKAREVNKLR
jgi:hypothetical protein